MLSTVLILAQSAATIVQPVDPAIVPIDAVYQEQALPDPVLAEQRGGFRLPNGIDVALSVQTQTVVDGAVVLQTVFAIDDGPASFAVYAPRDGSAVVVIPQGATAQPTAAVPTISYDSRSGVKVTPGFSSVPVSIGSGISPAGGVPEGLDRIDAAVGATTPNGQVSERTNGLLRFATLSSQDFSVAHFAGAAFGSAIANAGDGRAFDTMTSVSIDLRNAGPDVLGSTMFRVENVVLDALGSRM